MPDLLRHLLIATLLVVTTTSASPVRSERLPSPNPGFEEGRAPEGSPEGWRFYSSDTRIVDSSSWVRSGSAAVLLKERGLTAAFPIPSSGYFTVGCHAVSDRKGAKAALQLTSARTPGDRSPLTAAFLPDGRHRLLQASGKTIADLFSKVQVNLFSGPGEEVGFDDFFLLGNGLANPDFEEGLTGWTGTGIAWGVGEGDLPPRAILSPGATLSQEVSAEPYGTGAFFFQARSPAGSISFDVGIKYQDPVGGDLSSFTERYESGPEWQTFSLSVLLPATATAGSVGLTNVGDLSLEVTGFRHLALVTPVRCVSPNGDGINDTLAIETWIDPSMKGRLRLMDASHEVEDLTLGDGVAGGLDRTLWAPGPENEREIAPGSYRLRLEVEDPQLGLLTVHHPIEVVREPIAAPFIPAFPKDLFVRGFWLVVHNSFRPDGPTAAESEIEQEYDRLFEIIRSNHGNAALPAVLDHQYAPVRRAAERWGVHQIPSFFRPELLLRYADPLEEPRLWKSLNEAVGPWRDSPMFLGTYPLDEPPTDLFGRATQAARFIAALGGGKPSFFSLADTGILSEFAREVQPPVIAVHSYPFRKGGAEVDWEGYTFDLEKGAAVAQDTGAPFWAVLPTFEETALHRYPTSSEFRLCAHLALALGAKGLWCFTLNSSDAVEVKGMLDTHFRGGELLEAASRVYREVESLGTFLLGLRLAADAVQVEGPVYARTHVYCEGEVFVLLVNRDLERTVRGVLRSNPISLKTSRVQEIHPKDREILLQRTTGGWTAEVELEPGGWAVIRLEGIDGEALPPAEFDTENIGSLFQGLKKKAKQIALPDQGEFSWKQVGTIYPVGEGPTE